MLIEVGIIIDFYDQSEIRSNFAGAKERTTAPVANSQHIINKGIANRKKQKEDNMQKTDKTISVMHSVATPKSDFRTMLYLLVSIAVVFIGIIPAKYVSGMFTENDTAIFWLSLAGSIALLEFLAWCSLNGAWKIEESREAKRLRQQQRQQLLAEDVAKEPIVMESPEGVEPMTQTAVSTDSPKAEVKETAKELQAESNEPATDFLQLHQAGCDDYYKRLSDEKKSRLSAISEYVSYIMAPFIVPADMEAFSNEILSFAIDANYRPQPWKGLWGTLSSFDVRHLIWNITSRLGLGKGKPYSTDICASFIMTMFPDICEGLDLATLRNLRVTSTTDKIHLDEPKPNSFDFHIHK